MKKLVKDILGGAAAVGIFVGAHYLAGALFYIFKLA